MRRFGLCRRLPIVLGALWTTGSGQVIFHSGESAFVISVKGGPGVTFRGTYLVTTGTGESTEKKVEGTVPAEFSLAGTSVFLSFQNYSPDVVGGMEIRVDADGKRQMDTESAGASAHFLEVSISQNGTTVKEQRTDAPHGVISLATTMPPSGAPRQTELQVDGSAKFAFLTLTSETGDIEQQLVPIPFGRTFYPKEGWFVSLSAQKARVARLDPSSIFPQIQVLDDGVTGSLHVAIRVNGAIVAEAVTSQPFGVASTNVRLR